MKILCIGNASYDLTVPYDGFPVENTKNRVADIIGCGGGPASNAAYLLGKWGADVSFIGGVGNDDFGRHIIDELKSVNVKVDNMEIDTDAGTTLSVVIVNQNTGSRTTIAHRDTKMGLLRDYSTLKADVILIDGQERKISEAIIDNNPDAITVIDAGRYNDDNIALAKKVKHLVCSQVFAEDFAKTKINLEDPTTVVNIFQALTNEFKNNIVITLEANGCLYMKDGQIKLMPSIKVKPIDTTGAGDLFHGAFTYCMSMGYDLEKTLKISNITGALSVTKMGSRNSVFPLEEVMKVYEENI